MQLPSVLYLAVVILVFTVQVTSDCQLTKDEVEKETRIFAQKIGGKLHLLRRDKVAVGTTVSMICSATDIVKTTCKANGNFNPPLPIQNCPSNSLIKASVKPPESDPNCGYNMYRVGYKVNGEFLEVYRVCYDKDGVTAKYTQHRVYGYSIKTDRPKVIFTTDYIVSGAAAATFKEDAIYQRFEAVLGPNQKYIQSKTDLVFARGHLTPSADFVFVNNKKSTFKIINVVPKFQSINIGNWRRIESWVQQRAKAVGEVLVSTGTLDILSLKDISGNMVPMYLGANNINPIPKWIYKIVIESGARTVFVTYNNIYEPTMPAAICRTVHCPLELNASKESGRTYCCDPRDFQRVVPQAALAFTDDVAVAHWERPIRVHGVKK